MSISKYNLIIRIRNYFKSGDIPLWFKILNLVILVPILLYQFVFFITIFFFDNPKNFFLTFLLFLLVNAYPIYLALLTYGNYKLYRRNKNLALVLPLIILVTLISGTVYVRTSVQNIRNHAEEVTKQQINTGELGSGYKKDKAHVYFRDSIVDSADPSTFETVSWDWARDNKSYFFHGKSVPYIDRSTFEDLDYHYGKDKNNVYYDDQIIQGADAKTFQHIEGSQDGKDKNGCYRYGKKVDCSELDKDE